MTPRRGRWYLAGAAILAAAFAGLACASRLGTVLPAWDEQITASFVAWRTAAWDRTFWLFTILGDDPLIASLVAATVILLALWGRRLWATVVAGGMLLSWGVMHAAKELVRRARPAEALALVEQPGSDSLPSGHALISLVFCGLLIYLLFRWVHDRRSPGTAEGFARPRRMVERLGAAAALTLGAAVVTGAVLVVGVGLSRVYLGVHWMTDVLAGWCLGGALLVVIVGAASAWERTGAVGTLQGVRPWGSPRLRRAMSGIVVALMVTAAVLTGWADPLL